MQARFQFLSFCLFGIMLLASLAITHAQSTECTRQSENKDEPPEFLCSVTVTFVRNEDCSALITERFVFPHSSGGDSWRSIPALSAVSDIRLLKNDEEQEQVTTEKGDNGEVRVRMRSEKTADPVEFQLSYTLAYAVTRFTQSCESNADPDESKNVMRWRSGEWKLSFDKLSVTFQTENSEAKLAVLGDDNAASGSTSQKVTIQRTDVDDNVEFYVSESGAELCTAELECFPKGFNEIPLIIALCIIGLLIVGIAIWCTIRCRATHKKVQNENEAVSDIEAP